MNDAERRGGEVAPADSNTGSLDRDSASPGLSRARPCPACGGSRLSFDRMVSGGEGIETAIIRCLECSLLFVDPVPLEATAPASYGSAYYEPWQEGTEAARRQGLWRRRMGQIERRQPRGSLLDVGCGDGLFLKHARDAGWSVEGIEFSPEGARLSSQRLGRPVAVGDLSLIAGLRGPFDVVTLWHVLEHLVFPGAMLAAIAQRLRPGGLLVVAVPNLDNVPMQIAYRLARGRTLPLYEAGAREPHLCHFGPVSLESLLRRRGFERVEIRADRCALTPLKRALDAFAALLSVGTGRLLTDAMVAFARRPR